MHAPTLPKLKKTPKRILDLVHLLFASLWLGGFTIVFVCSIRLWTQTIDPVFGLATINFVQEVVKVCIPALMATGLLYGFATNGVSSLMVGSPQNGCSLLRLSSQLHSSPSIRSA